MAETSDFRKGMFILIDGQVHSVLDRKFKTQGRQGGLILLELKNVETGQKVSKTVKEGTKYEYLSPEYVEMQFTYMEGEDANFMNMETFETIVISSDVLDGYGSYLKEGDKNIIMFHEGKPLSIKKNPSVTLTVTESAPAVKGNTANGATKSVTTDTGLKVNVPLFIEQGDVITVNTESGEYSGKAN